MKKGIFTVIILAAFVLGGSQILPGIEMRTTVNVSSSPNSCKLPEIAFGPDGRVHIAYEEDWLGKAGSDIVYQTFDGNKWEKTYLTNTGDIDKKEVGIDCGEDGTIAVVWRQKDGFDRNIYLKTWDPDTEKWSASEYASGGWTGDTPNVAVDIEGNIHISWYQFDWGRCVTRSKINGTWEKVIEHSRHFPNRATQTGIVAAPNGTVWMIFRIKFAGSGEYKVRYTKRNLGQDWIRPKISNEGGASNSHPSITVDQNTNLAHIYYQDIDNSHESEIIRTTLDENGNPRSHLTAPALIHYPVGAWDKNGNEHLFWQYGAGGNGLGIKWKWRPPGGSWSSAIVLPRSTGGPKLCHADADKWGNVGVVWGSLTPSGEKDIFFTSTMEVKIRALEPPVNLAWNFDVQVISGAPQVTYTLSWEKNPKNKEDQVQGYNLYRKLAGEEDYVLLNELGKDELSRQLVYTSDSNKYLFAVSCMSTTDVESKLVEFLPTEED